MYKKILVALDGSLWSNLALETVQKLGEKSPSAKCWAAMYMRRNCTASDLNRWKMVCLTVIRKNRDWDNYAALMKTLSRMGCSSFRMHTWLLYFGQQKKADLYAKGLPRKDRITSKLLNLIAEYKPDLIVMGAWGHGRVPESQLGGLTERVLLHAEKSDLMIIR